MTLGNVPNVLRFEIHCHGASALAISCQKRVNGLSIAVQQNNKMTQNNMLGSQVMIEINAW